MTIKYMTDKDCLTLGLKDAYLYVRDVCDGNIVEAVAACLWGRTITAFEGRQYVLDNPKSKFGERFDVVLKKSICIVPATEDVVSFNGSRYLNNSDELTLSLIDQTDENQEKLKELKKECNRLENEKIGLLFLEKNKKEKINQWAERIAESKRDIREINQKINNIRSENNGFNVRIEKAKIKLKETRG